MAIIDDMDKHGFPGFISKFNGKPILINKSGTYNAYDTVSGEGQLAPSTGNSAPALGVMQVRRSDELGMR